MVDSFSFVFFIVLPIEVVITLEKTLSLTGPDRGRDKYRLLRRET